VPLRLPGALAIENFLTLEYVGGSTTESVVSDKNEITVLTKNARFLWLGALFVPPLSAFGAYELMPHEEIWHEVLYALLCVPIFGFWLIAVFGCIISFVSYRSTAGT